jgi:mRNA-degrading endonuclease YafQ of YafQ-DinJ toxin-antitoxin module
MMAEMSPRHIYVTSAFRRAAKRAIEQSPELADQIQAAVALLEANMFAPSLRSHKLQGDLRGCWACSVNYSVRIVFEVGRPEEMKGVTTETIVLLTVGTHDDVY